MSEKNNRHTPSMQTRQRNRLTMIIFIVALIAAGVVIYARLATPEDAWVCENDIWVKHGNPNSAAPTTGCGTDTSTNTNTADTTSIMSYQDCVNAGYPVMESYPPKCAIPNGQTFTQDIGNELEKADIITIDSPRPNATVTSPLDISGQARGSWYSEAEFPIILLDADGELLGSTTARATSDWMTTDFVPFTATLTYDTPTTDTGVLILSKENPSGLPELNDELIVPVSFTSAD